jgi:hypothetical protein
MIIIEHNVETGEVIEREATEQELAQRAKSLVEANKMAAEAEAKATQKAALLERLGISEDEARLLLA